MISLPCDYVTIAMVTCLFIEDELVKTGHNLHSINCSDMPAFGLVENLVDEEVGVAS